jgi:hypothetical protein
MGALTGAITGLFTAVGGFFGPLGAIAGGAAAGALNSAITGGDVAMGAAVGAIAATIGVAISGANTAMGAPLSDFSVSTASGAIGGGVGAELQGGDFWEGAMWGAAGSAMGYSLTDVIQNPAWRNLPSAVRKAQEENGDAISRESQDPQINDNKFGHADLASRIQRTLGPLGAPAVLLAGIGYEFYALFHGGHVPGGVAVAGPFDGQNPVNWLYDTPGDMLANALGQVSGLFLSPGAAAIVNRASFLIPGPNYSTARAATYGLDPTTPAGAGQLWGKVAPPGAAWPY